MERASLVNNLRGAQTFATTAIGDLQDFHVFTGYSYEQYAKTVAGGHVRGTIQNARTQTTLSESDMAPVLLKYLDVDLPRVVLYQAVAHFEFFYFDFLSMLLTFNPRALSPNRQLTAKDVVDASDYQALIGELIQREIIQLQYGAIAAWFAFLKKIVNIDVASEDIARFAELKTTRDVLAHNNGIANDTYLRKAGKLARGVPGQPLSVSRPYVYEAGDFLRAFITRLADSVCERLR
jgi:hypothetical protein